MSEESPHDHEQAPEDDDELALDEEAELEAGGAPRIPPSEPRDRHSMRFTVAVDRLSDVPLTVTVDDGRVAKSYAPADLIADLTDKVQELLRSVGGGLPAMFYGALGFQSMTLFFGDPRPDEAQGQLAFEATLSHARRIAELIDLDDEQELFANAMELGLPAQRYAELAHFVESEGITLRWTPRGDVTRTMTPEHAARQYARLSAEPPHDERTLTVNGVLYRVIADRQDHLGSVGIRLHSWSNRPPARHGVTRRSVIAPYEDESVEEAIKQGLIGEPVQASLAIRQPILGLSLDPEHVEIIVRSIAPGPSEDSRLGMRLDDLTDD